VSDMGSARLGGLAVIGLVVAFFAAQAPEIKRYLNIRGM